MIQSDENNKIEHVGQYKIIKTLAVSGYSNVYQVEDTKDGNKRYALKAIRNSNERYKLQNEIEIYKKIFNQENILNLTKVFKVSKRWFLLFEHAQDDLKNKVVSTGVLDEHEIFNVLRDMIKVLKFTRKLKIIHNDIKPANILIKENKYFLCDWGLSVSDYKAETLNIDTDRGYIAPEMFNGVYDIRADIYSLGCTLYYLAVGKKIFDIKKESSSAYIMYAHCFLNPKLEQIQSNKLKYLIHKLTEKNSDKRLTLEDIEKVLKSNETFQLEENENNHEYYQNKNSFELYELLKEKNVLYAYNNLAFLYESYEEKKDLNQALFLYETAAKKGLVNAMYNLGVLYFFSKDIPQDKQKAFFWFNQASLKHHVKAQYCLGLFYEEGLVVTQDMKKAHKLFKISAYAGYKKAYKKLKELHKRDMKL